MVVGSTRGVDVVANIVGLVGSGPVLVLVPAWRVPVGMVSPVWGTSGAGAMSSVSGASVA
jgi:hypothetical protein